MEHFMTQQAVNSLVREYEKLILAKVKVMRGMVPVTELRLTIRARDSFCYEAAIHGLESRGLIHVWGTPPQHL